MRLALCSLLVASAASMLYGCGSSSYGSDAGINPTVSTAGPPPSGSTAKPGISDAPGSLTGSNDAVVATASTALLAVEVGGRATLSITFTSNDGLPMTGFGISGTLNTLPAGFTGPTSFVCTLVSTGSGCVLDLNYAPTAADSGMITLTYVVIENSTMPSTPGSVTVAYAATAHNNIVAAISPSGQITAPKGGSQSVSVSFTTDDGNPATGLSVTSNLAGLPAGWSSGATGLACAVVSTGSGCELTLDFAPTGAVSGSLQLNYAFTDESGAAKTGTLTIPYFTTASNNVVATAAPSGQVTAVQMTGSQSVPVTFTTDDGQAASNLFVTSDLTALPAGWSSAFKTFSCGSVNTGNGCQLDLHFAPPSLVSGTLPVTYAYTDSSGAARTGLLNIEYAATTNDDVVGTASPSGQVTAVVGSGAVPVTVTFGTNDQRPATTLTLRTSLSALPPGWTSTATALSCPALDALTVCSLPLSFAPGMYGSGTLALAYGYVNNAGQSKAGTVQIPYRATTNDSVVSTPSPTSLAVRTGSSTPVTVTLATNDGNPAGALTVAGLGALPDGWTSTADSFTCATVSAGSPCTLALNYAPSVAAGSNTLNLSYAYTNDAGYSGTAATTGTISIAYSAVTPYLYVADATSATVSVCALHIDDTVGSCTTTGSGLNGPNGLAIAGSSAYIADTAGNAITLCTLGAAGTWTGCAGTGGTLAAPTAITVNNADTFAYVQLSTGVAVCSVAATDGTLSGCTAAGAPFIAGSGVVLSVDGQHAYGLTGPTTLAVCTVAANGTFNGCTGSTATVAQAAAVLAIHQTTLYVATTIGTVLECPLNADASVGVCQSATLGANADALAFIDNTAYVSTGSAQLLACPVSPSGALGSCAPVNDASFDGTAGLAIR